MNNNLQGLPLVILFQPAASLSEKDSMRLKDTMQISLFDYLKIFAYFYNNPRLQEEGQNLADSLQSPFIEVYNDDDDFNNYCCDYEVDN